MILASETAMCFDVLPNIRFAYFASGSVEWSASPAIRENHVNLLKRKINGYLKTRSYFDINLFGTLRRKPLTSSTRVETLFLTRTDRCALINEIACERVKNRKFRKIWLHRTTAICVLYNWFTSITIVTITTQTAFWNDNLL